MYFEIENTPEHIKRARKVLPSSDAVEKEECPRLVLAPFARPPQVVFDKVVVGTSVQRHLEVLNPTKNVQQITLGRALPPGLNILISGEWLELEAETCYEITLQWSPLQPMALRETIRFVNENRRQFDVVVVLKTMSTQKKNNKGKNNKTVKISPQRVTKKTTQKKSPISNINMVKKVILDGVKMKQSSEEILTYKTVKSHYKETLTTYYNDFTTESTYKHLDKSPFDSPCVHFDMSEIFSNVKKSNLQQTIDKENSIVTTNDETYGNILKQSNKQNTSDVDIFDNLSFTPLKSKPTKSDKHNDSFELCDKENTIQINNPTVFKETVPDINKWPTLGHTPYNLKYTENILPNKKIPNTSSPKELDSVNFTMNTDFSRISNDLSFLPHRFSTEKKSLIKPLYKNENELEEDHNINSILNSNTYTKSESPINMYPSMDYHIANQLFDVKIPKSKQALFRERSPINDRKNLNIDRALEKLWNYNVSPPPRSISPQQLHAIAEESTHCSESKLFDNTGPQMKTFTVNRTFNKFDDRHATTKARDSWSKKFVKCEPELWKIPTVPAKKSISTKDLSFRRETINFKPNTTTELNVTNGHNTFLSMPNCVGDVYSQSSTVDPFLSSTYFYDERAIYKFENEFKRWLNYILTPPADLETNIENKIDVSKIWVENRNKDIPAAPTKEQVSSKYHNSHRLDALRKSARGLFISHEFTVVIRKLNAHIEKKVICIRSDKNLHIDVGLQKIIMELLLCYNPLWLRIGLETIYGLVIPLKSNSDIEGLSTFIIQRMFRNPFLKSKNSKGNAPNMLLPAYLEAIKKFTLKKFFMLVYFLDRAKHNRLIPHDPCLFCRNAICKESREMLIRFTRELIAGIGDITKHLRLLGYIVGQKQSYLDEYKYAVHNIASDIRDGVRLTKVMEIILIKNGLLSQLRTPAISRLQKIHNVQVAFNALKEANFAIVGDIAAQDIADGHREKTLSLLWQIIHVFRAPLFQNAASVIQAWWRKKYEAIIAQRKIEEEIQRRRHNAASAIQGWWRGIQYRRMLVIRRHQVLTATVSLQKYWRIWIYKRREQRIKRIILLQSIIRGYLVRKKYAERKEQLRKIEEEKRMLWATTKLQSYFRMWICRRRFQELKKVITVQAMIRGYLARKMCATMREELKKIEEEKKLNLATTKIQNFFRMVILKRRLLRLKQIILVQAMIRGYLSRKRYAAMREELRRLEEEKRNRCATKIQSYYRMVVCKRKLQKLKKIVLIQTICRGFLARKTFSSMKELKRIEEVKRINHAATKIQSYWRMVGCQRELKRLKHIVIAQSVIRRYLAKKRCAAIREELRKIEEENRRNCASIKIQSYWRMVTSQRKLLKLKQIVKLQAIIRGHLARKQYAAMKKELRRIEEEKRRNSAAIKIQSFWRMVKCQRQLKTLKNIVRVQAFVRGYLARRMCAAIREELRRIEEENRRNIAAIKIQSFWKMVICQRELMKLKNIVRIQAVIRGYLTRIRCAAIRKELRRIEEENRRYLAAIKIQNFFRMVICIKRSLKLKRVILIQSVVRRYLARKIYLTVKEEKRIETENNNITAATKIQSYWRMYICKKRLLRLKKLVLLQAVIRGYLVRLQCAAKREELRRIEQERIRNLAAINIQKYYRMLYCRRRYQKLKLLIRFQAILRACVVRQKCAVKLEDKRRNLAATTIQNCWRRYSLRQYLRRLNQIILLQAVIRGYLVRKQCAAKREELKRIEEERRNHAATKIQSYWRMVISMRRLQTLKKIVIVQSVARAFIARRKCATIREEYRKLEEEKRRNYAATKIQICYRTWKQRRYMLMLRRITLVQSVIRGYIARKQYATKREELKKIEEEKRKNIAATTLQSYWRVIICKRRFLMLKKIVCIQAAIRGYLARKMITEKKEELKKIKEEKIRSWAATKIQACYRAHLVRKRESSDHRVVDLRKRWREGALRSTQQTISDRNKEALDIIANFYDIETVIRAFKSLELLTEVYPMLYCNNARDMSEDVLLCMAVTNRSISSVELLTSAAAVLANLARYPRTAALIYQRENIQAILKYMLRFCTKETRLFCIMCTYLWLFNKYERIRQDLAEYLHLPDNHKTLISIKKVTERMVRMSVNANKHKLYTPQAKRKPGHTFDYSMNYSLRYNPKLTVLPTLEPDYGIVKADRPRYFQDPLKAIETLFVTFNL